MLDALVYLVAAVFAGLGLYGLARPAGVLATFDVAVESAEGRNEVRAVYGGFGLAVAALLGVAAAGEGGVREGILVAVGFALAGMAAGRLVSALADRHASAYPVATFLGIEIAAAALLLAAAWA